MHEVEKIKLEGTKLEIAIVNCNIYCRYELKQLLSYWHLVYLAPLA